MPNWITTRVCRVSLIGKDVPDDLAYPMVLKRLLMYSRRTATGCLEWTRWRNAEGYGYTSFRNHPERTHGLMFRAVKGPIQKGMIIRHTCDNPSCMEPSHLLIGTEADNTADSLARGRHFRAAKTHCKRGHDLAIHAKVFAGGGRSCQACAKLRYHTPNRVIRRNESSHCTAGHELSGDNRYVSPRGYVECQTCRTAARFRFVQRRKAISTSNNPDCGGQ